jgi:hypothetical protein
MYAMCMLVLSLPLKSLLYELLFSAMLQRAYRKLSVLPLLQCVLLTKDASTGFAEHCTCLRDSHRVVVESSNKQNAREHKQHTHNTVAGDAKVSAVTKCTSSVGTAVAAIMSAPY